MRLNELQLLKFGAFEGQVLRFAGVAPGLHVVFGQNEAGKSTALRALKALLFGIPRQSRDGFLHGSDVLSVGAVMRFAGGHEFEIQRWKRAPTLRGKDGRPADAAPLDACTGSMDLADFERFFGIDYDELLAGSRMLLSEKNDLSTSIFSAGLGALDVRGILKELDEQARNLFKKRARGPAINAALAEYDDAQRALKDSSLSARMFEQKEEELEIANSRLEELRRTANAFQVKKAKLERIRRTRGNVAELRNLEAELSALGNVVQLPEGFIAQRKEHTELLRRLSAEVGERLREIAGLDEELSQLRIPDALLAEESAVTALHTELKSYCDARRDLPACAAEADQHREAAAVLLKTLRPGAALADAESLRLRQDQLVRIQACCKEEPALRSKLESLAESLGALKEKFMEHRGKLEKLQPPRSIEHLKSLIKGIEKKGALEAQLAERREACAAAREDSECAMKRLPRWAGTLAQLAELKVPSAESINDHEQRLQRAQAAGEKLDTKIEGQDSLIRTAREEIARLLKESGDLPTAVDLRAARERREQGWSLIRRAWLEHEDVSADSQSFAPATPLQDAYAQSVQRADEIADRRFADASAVAKHEQCLERIASANGERAGLILKRDALANEIHALEERWQNLWTALGIEPGTAAVMRDWLARQNKIIEALNSLREDERECERLESQISDCRARLVAALVECNEEVHRSASLEQVLVQAHEYCKRQEKLFAQREKIEEAAAEAEKDLKKKTSEHSAEGKWKEWQEKWRAAVIALNLSADAGVHEAEQALECLRALFDKLDKLPELDRRIKSMQAVVDSFERRAAALTQQLYPGLARLSPDAAAAELNLRLKKALADKQRRAGIADRRVDAENKNSRANTTMAELRARLEEACKIAGCTDAADLAAAEERFTRHIALQEKIAAAKASILRSGDGLSLDQLLAELAAVHPDAVEAEMSQVDGELAALETEISRAHDARSAVKTQRDAMDGGERAAGALEQAQRIAAQVRDQAEQYVRLRAASALLQREIERFNTQNQTPLLRHASAIFSILTGKTFSGLRAESNEAGEHQLAGLRDGRAPVSVDCMSDGTRDQLYLALRLGHLKLFLEKEHIDAPPFVVDDVLVNFDDKRCTAAFKVLHDLAPRIQVIVFTHHRHLLELAQSAAPAGVWKCESQQGLEVHSHLPASA